MTAPAAPADAPLDGVDRRPAVSRDARLAQAISRLRGRAGQATGDRWLVAAGPTLLVFGAAVILLGWYGASQTSRLYVQIPYLISGGLLGLGFIFAGGFLYFSRWLTELVGESRRQAHEAHELAASTVASLERIEQLLRDGALAPARSATRAAGAAASSDGAAPLVRTPKGKLVHRPDCQMVAGRDDVVPVNGDRAGLETCRVCEPEVA